MKCLHGMDSRWCSHCTGFVMPKATPHVLRMASPELMAALRKINAKCVEVQRANEYPIIFKKCYESMIAALYAGVIHKSNVSYRAIDCKDVYLQLTVLRGQDLL